MDSLTSDHALTIPSSWAYERVEARPKTLDGCNRAPWSVSILNELTGTTQSAPWTTQSQTNITLAVVDFQGSRRRFTPPSSNSEQPQGNPLAPPPDGMPLTCTTHLKDPPGSDEGSGKSPAGLLRLHPLWISIPRNPHHFPTAICSLIFQCHNLWFVSFRLIATASIDFQ
jgi:hypothetical protein